MPVEPGTAPELQLSMNAWRKLGAAAMAVAFLMGSTVHAAPIHHRRPAAPAAAPQPSYAGRADVRAFIAEMADDYGFDAAALRRAFAAARFQPEIIAAMQRPLLEPPKWFEYAPQFLARRRIEGGVAFWSEHADVLARAEREFGVPPEIIVAIIGVETFYGRNTGRHRVLDALSTLAFDYPRRAVFFRGELKHFLLLTRDLGVSPIIPKGSFAGAVGLPQFMPGSYRNFAVDFDGDGRIDLWTSADDTIGSVANFLARHDWARDQPVLLPAVIAEDHRDAVLRRLDGGLSERRAPEAWLADGVRPADASIELASDPVGLLLLEEGPAADAASYWIACNNFYVITRYNRSRLYAAAVWNLARAIRTAYAVGP